MLAPQSGQTRLRIAEIKPMLVFLTTANEAIISLLCGDSSPPNAQNLMRGAGGAFWGGRRWTVPRPRFGFKSESNCVAKCFAQKVSASANVYPVSMKEIG
jgi:hypothetical protein